MWLTSFHYTVHVLLTTNRIIVALFAAFFVSCIIHFIIWLMLLDSKVLFLWPLDNIRTRTREATELINFYDNFFKSISLYSVDMRKYRYTIVNVCMRVQITKENKSQPDANTPTTNWSNESVHRLDEFQWIPSSETVSIILWFEVRSSKKKQYSSYILTLVHTRTLLKLNHWPNIVIFANSHKSLCLSLCSLPIRKKKKCAVSREPKYVLLPQLKITHSYTHGRIDQNNTHRDERTKKKKVIRIFD